ncbi:unnamed protein product [Arctia plantaginis]|uniref:Uncharacterized protein n=1 Tax=Arctia plantaginis TaxID=874455 RepID=A0A8S0Z3X5_ARCPL|nr:unnamed protein product [Arctia plantaginis]
MLKFTESQQKHDCNVIFITESIAIQVGFHEAIEQRQYARDRRARLYDTWVRLTVGVLCYGDSYQGHKVESAHCEDQERLEHSTSLIRSSPDFQCIVTSYQTSMGNNRKYACTKNATTIRCELLVSRSGLCVSRVFVCDVVCIRVLIALIVACAAGGARGARPANAMRARLTVAHLALLVLAHLPPPGKKERFTKQRSSHEVSLNNRTAEALEIKPGKGKLYDFSRFEANIPPLRLAPVK